MASALSYKAITICGELWEDTQRRNAAPARATLPLDQSLSAGRTEESPLNKVDSIARVRAATTPPTPRGDHRDGPRQSPPEPSCQRSFVTKDTSLPAYRALQRVGVRWRLRGAPDQRPLVFRPRALDRDRTALRLKKRGAPQTDRQLVAEATAEAAA